jgi:hypothetical protein
MKTAGSFFLFVVTGLGAFAQNGTIAIQNTSDTLFRTNNAALGGGIGAPITSTAGSYYYEVLTAPSSVTSVDPSLQDLLTSTWLDTGVSGTNMTGSSFGGRELGRTVASALNWSPGTTQSFVVVGWSASLGSTWGQVKADLSGASLVPQNGGFYFAAQHPTAFGYLGATIVGQAVAGPAVGPPALLFGLGPGNVSSTTDLYPFLVPEPGSLMLAGLGSGILLGFRGRKKP